LDSSSAFIRWSVDLGLELLVGGNLAGVQGDGHRRISRRGLLAPFAVFSRCHGDL
jgi:hypothetical protein